MKKALCILLAALALCSMAAPALAAKAGDTLYASEPVYMRSGPATSYSPFYELLRGEQVTYLGKSGKWQHVEYLGATGYIHSNYLTNTKPLPFLLYTTERVAVFAGTATGDKLLFELKSNTKVEYAGTSGVWTRVQYEDGLGFIQSKYLSAVPSENTLFALATGKANVRNGPGSKNKRLGQLEKGTELTVSGIMDEKWASIHYNGAVGYISLSDIVFVDKQPPKLFMRPQEMADVLSQTKYFDKRPDTYMGQYIDGNMLYIRLNRAVDRTQVEMDLAQLFEGSPYYTILNTIMPNTENALTMQARSKEIASKLAVFTPDQKQRCPVVRYGYDVKSDQYKVEIIKSGYDKERLFKKWALEWAHLTFVSVEK